MEAFRRETERIQENKKSGPGLSQKLFFSLTPPGGVFLHVIDFDAMFLGRGR